VSDELGLLGPAEQHVVKELQQTVLSSERAVKALLASLEKLESADWEAVMLSRMVSNRRSSF
jgi:hypothetical protein